MSIVNKKREPTVWTLFYRILTALPRIPLSIHNICYWLLNNAQANLMQIFRNKNVAWNLLFMKYIFQIFKGFSKCVSIGSNQTTGFTIVHICQFPRKKVKSAVCIVSKLFTALWSLFSKNYSFSLATYSLVKDGTLNVVYCGMVEMVFCYQIFSDLLHNLSEVFVKEIGTTQS